MQLDDDLNVYSANETEANEVCWPNTAAEGSTLANQESGGEPVNGNCAKLGIECTKRISGSTNSPDPRFRQLIVNLAFSAT